MVSKIRSTNGNLIDRWLPDKGKDVKDADFGSFFNEASNKDRENKNNIVKTDFGTYKYDDSESKSKTKTDIYDEAKEKKENVINTDKEENTLKPQNSSRKKEKLNIVYSAISPFIFNFSIANYAVLQNMETLTEGIIKEIVGKFEEVKGSKVLFRFKGESPFEVSIEEIDGKLFIEIYSKGDIKQDIVDNINTLAQALKKKLDKDLDIEVFDLPDRGDGNSSKQEHNSDDSNQESLREEDVENSVEQEKRG
ncbi:MAG: hypothetical protein GY730_02765 [bacterium]|nr:hypothetical protein [bacterium]